MAIRIVSVELERRRARLRAAERAVANTQDSELDDSLDEQSRRLRWLRQARECQTRGVPICTPPGGWPAPTALQQRRDRLLAAEYGLSTGSIQARLPEPGRPSRPPPSGRLPAADDAARRGIANANASIANAAAAFGLTVRQEGDHLHIVTDKERRRDRRAGI
jgi:hypothetical protein